jgi:hypothetical protein
MLLNPRMHMSGSMANASHMAGSMSGMQVRHGVGWLHLSGVYASVCAAWCLCVSGQQMKGLVVHHDMYADALVQYPDVFDSITCIDGHGAVHRQAPS